MILAIIVLGALLTLIVCAYLYTSPPSFNQTSKQLWIKEAKNYFLNHANLEDWDDAQIQEYLEDLHKHFVPSGYSGKQAVKEDMSYWEREE